MERTPEAYTRGILAATLEPWFDGLEKVNAALQTDAKLRSQVEDPGLAPAAKADLLADFFPGHLRDRQFHQCVDRQ